MATKFQLRIGWLFDGKGGPGQKDVVLTIDKGRFAAIRPSAQSLMEESEYLDLSAFMVLPPLMDSHVHLCMSGTVDAKVRNDQLSADYEALQPFIARHLHHFFSHGVLVIRDGGDRGNFVHRFLSEQPLHSEMVVATAGRAFHRQGRYGRLIGRSVGADESLADSFHSDPGMPDTKWLKVVNSGLNSLRTFGKVTDPQFSVEELRALVAAADRHNKKVMVHANGDEPVRRAITAGCHSIEHGFFMGKDNLKRMADSGTYWVPTLFTMKAYRDNLAFVAGPADARVIDMTLAHQLEQLARARELGVRVALGSDSGSLGVLHGESLVEEMKLYLKAGYTIGEVIQCVSAHGAALLDLKDYGVIEPGAKATFLIARGVPGQLPRKLSYLEGIWVNGAPSQFYRKNPSKHVSQPKATGR
jgi:imidazolonepropionase-like amidohydrolase